MAGFKKSKFHGCRIFSRGKKMALVVKPVSINRSTYLRVPREMEELITLMTPRVCTVDVNIDEKGCELVYSFAKPIPDLTEKTAHKPLWIRPMWMEKELAA